MNQAVLDRPDDPVDTAIALSEGTWEQVPSVRFSLVVPMLKAFEVDGKKRLSGVASSTTKDLHGDTMEETALQDMERDANDNLTIFLNHQYNVPEDVAGSVIKAKMTRRGADQDGEPNWDLDYEIEIDETNERAVKAWNAVKAGRKLGLSIGAMIPAGGAMRSKKDGTLRIQHVKLLETSIVGIPANQRSWISLAKSAVDTAVEGMRRDAGRAAKAGSAIPLGSPTMTLSEDGEYHIRGRMADITLGVEPDVAAAGCPDCGKPKGSSGCSNPYHKDVEPDVQDSRIRVIEIDTEDKPKGDSSDGSSSDDESTDESDEETLAGDPEVTASDDPTAPTGVDGESVVTASEQPEGTVLTVLEQSLEGGDISEIAGALTASISLIAALESELATEKAARLGAEQALSTFQTETYAVLRDVAELVRRVGDLPLSRKSKLAQASATDGLVSRLRGVYPESTLKMLFQEDKK